MLLLQSISLNIPDHKLNKALQITLPMEQLVTHLSASHPLITNKPRVIPLEALGLPGEQPYMILVQMITVTLPKLLFKPLDTEQTLKLLAQSSKIHVTKTLV